MMEEHREKIPFVKRTTRTAETLGNGKMEGIDVRQHLLVCVFISLSKHNLAPTQHTPSREACHLIVGRVLPLL